MKQMVDFEDIKKQWLQNPEFKSAYEALEIEHQLALELFNARTRAGLTQEQVAKRMGTTQSVIARLESGGLLPSMKTIHRYANATGTHLHLTLS